MYFEFRILIVSYDVPLHYIRIYLFYGNKRERDISDSGPSHREESLCILRSPKMVLVPLVAIQLKRVNGFKCYCVAT